MTDYPVDDNTTIRVRPTGRGDYYAVELNQLGHETVRMPFTAETPDAAYQGLLDILLTSRETERAKDALEDAGVFADLTIGPREGIYRQVQNIAPSPVRPGVCPTCGLDVATCDCR